MAESSHLLEHVQDADYFELPHVLGGKWEIPQPLESVGVHITKFMILELVAALLVVAVFVPLAVRIRSGAPVRGRFWNLFEAMLLYIRDNVARPAIGAHDGDKFLPYLWTLFFFVLFCNLLGILPWSGTPTSALGVTAVLAAMTLLTVMTAGMQKLGVVGYWKAQVPHMDLPGILAVFLLPMIFAIEVVGLFIKHVVLAVRLLANMFAGHVVLAVIIGFIAMSANSLAWYGIMPASVLGSAALSLLELFVAFLQAYILTFLSALFIGMAVHPH